MGNGDILADCSLSGGPSGIYVFELGRPPRLAFRSGQTLNAATSGGAALATMSTYGLIDANAARGGDDSWAGSDGSVMVSARLVIGPTTLDALLIAPNIGSDIIMQDDFE